MWFKACMPVFWCKLKPDTYATTRDDPDFVNNVPTSLIVPTVYARSSNDLVPFSLMI